MDIVPSLFFYEHWEAFVIGSEDIFLCDPWQAYSVPK